MTVQLALFTTRSPLGVALVSEPRQGFAVFKSMPAICHYADTATRLCLTQYQWPNRVGLVPNIHQNNTMKTAILVLTLISTLTVFSQAAEAKGCLKGAVVGGVGGHVAGGHGLLGAGAGCLVGRHMANKKAQQEAAGNAQTPVKK